MSILRENIYEEMTRKDKRVFYEEKLFPRKYDVNFAWYLRGNSLRVFSEEIFESTNFIGVTRFFCPPN